MAVLIGFASLFALAEWLRVKGRSVEVTRKFIHVGSGTITLFFTLLFSSHWPVLIMTVLCCVALLLVRLRRPLGSLHGVDRRSWGEICFPLGIYLAFYFADLYNVLDLYPFAVAYLIFADSAAAVIGKRYGSQYYYLGEERKSIVGSVVFFSVAFMIGYVATGSISSAMLTAALLMLLESTATKGVDNLVLPLAALVMLHEGFASSSSTASVIIAIASLTILAIASIGKLDARMLVLIALVSSSLLFKPAAIPILLLLIFIGAMSSLRVPCFARLRSVGGSEQ